MRKVLLAGVLGLVMASTPASASPRQAICPMTDNGPTGELCAVPLTAHRTPQTIELPATGPYGILTRLLGPDGGEFTFGRDRYGCISQARYHGIRARLRYCKGEATQVTYRSTAGPKPFVLEYR